MKKPKANNSKFHWAWKFLFGATLIAVLSWGTYAYSLSSNHPMAYKIRQAIGLQSQSWNQTLVETYVELRLASRRLGQRTPKGNATRLAILKEKGYTKDSYKLAVERLKADYHEWENFQQAVVLEFERIKKAVKAKGKKAMEKKRAARKAAEDNYSENSPGGPSNKETAGNKNSAQEKAKAVNQKLKKGKAQP